MDKNNVLAALFAALFAVSEYSGLNNKIRENSVVELVGSFILKLLRKKEDE